MRIRGNFAQHSRTLSLLASHSQSQAAADAVHALVIHTEAVAPQEDRDSLVAEARRLSGVLSQARLACD